MNDTLRVLVPCRDAEPAEIPKAAASVLANALATGWTARTTYAKVRVFDAKSRAFAYDDRVTRAGLTGSVRDVHKDKVHVGVLVDGLGQIRTWEVAETQLVTDADRVGKVIESLAVRLRRGPEAAHGEWWDGRFHHSYAWAAGVTASRIGALDLGRLVKGAV